MSHVVRSARPANVWCHRCKARLRSNQIVRVRSRDRARAYPFCRPCARTMGAVA